MCSARTIVHFWGERFPRPRPGLCGVDLVLSNFGKVAIEPRLAIDVNLGKDTRPMALWGKGPRRRPVQAFKDVKDRSGGPRPWGLAWGLVMLGLCGCAGFWDEVTSRDFKMKNLFSKPDPLVTLRDSSDGYRRCQALAQLQEPLQNGGDQEKQEFYVQILTEAATKDPDPLCRLGAIRSLADYKDPRAARTLEDVYLQNLKFSPELNSTIRMQTLAALEKAGDGRSRELLIRVARQPGGGTESSMADRQQTNDERLTAIRALARFNNFDAIDTLVYVLETEKDIALQQRAYDSLRSATGKDLPMEGPAWRAMLQKNSNGEIVAREGNSWWKLVSFPGN
jgi:hypothetical protein